MIPHLVNATVSKFVIAFALFATIAIAAIPVCAGDAKPAAPTTRKARVDWQAINQEIIAQGEGIHKLSDDSVCVKSGRGMAHIHADGHGCGTGCVGNPGPVGAYGDLTAGIFYAFFMQPQEAAKLGIGPDQAGRIKDAFNYMDHAGTNPSAVLKLYEQYAKAAEGKARADAEKALMDKVHAVGQAYVDAEVKKLKDVKALLTPDQMAQIRRMGAKLVRPKEKQLD